MPLPPLPQSLQAALTARAALSVSEYVGAFRSMGSQFPTQNADALERLQQQSDGLTGNLNSVISQLQAISNTVLTSSSILEVALVTAVTTHVTAPNPITPGDRLTVFATQDGTGFGLISFGSMFRFMSVNLDPTASTVSVWDTVGRVDPADNILKWFLSSVPLIGQS